MSLPNSQHPLILPQIEESKLIFEESLIKIRRDKLHLAGKGSYSYYTLLTKPSAVFVLATTADGSYVLIEEYRHPTGRVLLSCPGGYIDEGELPIEAAKRELLEETGFQAEFFEILGHAFPYAGISGQKTFYIKAKGATRLSPPRLEPSEILTTVIKSQAELDQMVASQVDLDANLCTALFFSHYHKK